MQCNLTNDLKIKTNFVGSNHLIHIGYPKTATKWFQKVFFPNVKNGYYINHNVVKESIISPNDFYYKPSKKILNKVQGKRVVLSEENLLGSIQDGGMQRLHTKEMGYRLKVLFPSGQIIIFIRNQISTIASTYLQYIKMGGNHSVKNFLFDKDYSFTAKRKLFSFDFLKYDEVIEFYQNLFGKDQVFVYLYEDFAENPKAFVEKFKKVHNLEVELTDLNFSPINKRYGKILVLISKLLNSFTKRPLIYKYYLIHVPKWHFISTKMKRFLSSTILIGKNQKDEQILGTKTCQYIKDYYADSNCNLPNLIGLEEKLNKYNFFKTKRLR